jgi:PIN domain nuclease of toxin-antitoxin system
MNLLFDTHALIWWVENNPRLGKDARQAISTVSTVRVISVVSVWEMAIKTSLGRLKLSVETEKAITELFFHGFEPLSIQFRHAYAVQKLPLHHGDPFDRMLVAQAQCESLTILTTDPKLRMYDVPTLDASI